MPPIKTVRTLAEREKIILEVEKNPTESKVSIAKRLGLPISTLNSILYHKQEIREQIAKCGKSSLKRKTSRESAFSELEDVLYTWYTQARASRIPVDGPVLREKALQIAARLGLEEDEFNASNGWLQRFKHRRGLVYKKLAGESAAVDPETVDMWMAGLPEIIRGYAPRDIYNADETGLFYNILPDKTLTLKGEACHGGKSAKDRITVLVCANSDGTDKTQLLVIGKAFKPRCFGKKQKLPVTYHANKKAWMTTNVFMVFLRSFDAKMGTQGRKILLFLDNCAAHPPDTQFLKNIKVVYFPANCTSALQPMDAGVINCLKHHYRKRLVKKAILLLDSGNSPKTMKINVLQAIHYVVSAWHDVKPSAIENCFKKCGFQASDDDIISLEEPDDDFSDEWALVNDDDDVTFDTYVAVDDNVVTCGNDTIETLCDAAVNNEDESEDDDEEAAVIPDFSEVIASFEKVRLYMYAQPIDETEMSLVVNMENALYNMKRKAGKKQTSIMDYFKK